MDMQYISELIQAILLATLPILAAQLSALLLAAYRDKLAGMSDRNRWVVEQAVSIGIKAAEQVYKAGSGEDKKYYALSVAEEYIAKYGVTVDFHLLEAQIEAAVFSELDHKPVAAG